MAKKNKARKKKPGSGSTDTSPSALLHRALKHHQAGKLSEAERGYRSVLSKDPDHILANYYLGVIALQTGNNEQAEKLLAVAASQDPNNTDILNNLGAALMLRGKTDAAADCFHKALAINPALADAHNNLGKICRDRGQPAEAIEHYRAALALNPNLFEALRNMGIALRDSGAPEQSVATLQQAVTLRPDDAIAWLQLGVSLKEKGVLGKAADAFKQAIELRADLLDSYIELGNLFHQQGDLAAAESWFQQALNLKPDYAKAHNNLGVIFHEQEEFERAIDHLRRAIAIDPDYPEAANHLGTILIQAGEREEGIGFLRRAISLKPDYAIAHRHLSNACRHTQRDADITAMEELYAADQTSSDQRMHLAFGLAKAYEELEEYPQAFQCLATGNRLKRESYNYSLGNEREVFAAIKQAFAPAPEADEASGNPDDTPIFIIGMPRSGTSLTEQILASHPQVVGAGERHELWQIARRLCDTPNPTDLPGCIAGADRELLQRLGTEYVQRLRRFSASARYIVDKMPHNFLFLGIIRRALPNARIIHCERDPVDNCLSIFKNFFVAEHGYAYDLQELGEYYLLYRDLMQFWHERYPGIIHRLSYEAMVADQEQTTRSLLEYCDLPWDDACLQFHKTSRSVKTASSSQVRRPIYKKSVALWKQYERELAPLLEILGAVNG
jgi:tetratricopeptide (TPR) repeat protein